MVDQKKIITSSEFKPTDLNFAPPGHYSKGGKFVPLSYGPGKQRVNLQIPSLFCPFGVSVFQDPRTAEKTYSIDVAFKDLTNPKQKACFDAMLHLDQLVLSKAADPSNTWFDKPMSKEMLAELYRPLIKQPKDPRYSPSMKIKIPVAKGVPTTEFYNEARERVTIDSITKGCSIMCILELRPG